MGKSRSIYNLDGIDPAVEITKHLSRKGKLRANNKKEKKALESICTHHKVNKKGYRKPLISKPHGANCTCEACKDEVALKFFTHQERVRDMQKYRMHVTQGKYIGEAVNADRRTIQDLCELTLRMDRSIKILDNLTAVAKKQDKVKKKKKNRKANYSSSYGGWNIK